MNITSDFINLEFSNENMSSVYERANVLLYTNTHTLTLQTCGIHDDITKHKQPEASVGNVN